MFDLFGWLRKRVSDSFTAGIADGLRQAGVSAEAMPPELQAMQQKVTAPALAAKEEGETPEPEQRKAGWGK